MNKKQKEEFFQRLESGEGCNFRKDEKNETIWRCYGGNDKRFSRLILKRMKVSKIEANKFLKKCDDNGWHCDCEILFNAEEPIMGEK